MIVKNENGFGWASLLMSVLFFIAGWVSFRSPSDTLMTLGLFFGVIAIVQGFLSIVVYPTLRRVFERNPWPVIVIGILDLFIGIYLIMNPTLSIAILPIVFAIWFIADSVRNIVIAFRLRKSRQKWFWINAVLGVLGIILGIFLISNLSIAVVSIAYLIAFYFFLAGAIKLIDAFV